MGPKNLIAASIGLLLSGAAPLGAQTEIEPYASEGDLGALIGKPAKVDGVFHKSAFAAPAIAISGRVFYLLENPPAKRTFDFPNDSRNAVVTGTLYLYDGNQQFSNLYEPYGRRFYFFSIGGGQGARIEFGDPIKPSSASAANPMDAFIGSWRLDAEAVEAELFKVEDELARTFLSGFIEVLKSSELKIQPDRISTIIPKNKKRVTEPSRVLSAVAGEAELEVSNKIIGTYLLFMRIDSEGRLVMKMDDREGSSDIDFDLFYNRW